MTNFLDARSRNGHPMDELSSWLQKAVRRGLYLDAVYCAVELDTRGFPETVWKILRHSVSEDIGLAEPGIASDFQALYQMWKDEVKHDKTNSSDANRLHIVHAVLMCCQAAKSRLVDDMLITVYEQKPPEHREVPDWALDMHTQRGRFMGRGVDHFFEEGAKLANRNPGIENPFTEKARSIRKKKEKPPMFLQAKE